jgi:xylulokinase
MDRQPAGRAREPLLLGLDIGSTNVKAVVYEPDGTALSVSCVPQETTYPQASWANYDPLRLWELSCQVIRQAISGISDLSRIVSVAVTSFGEAGVLIDAAGEPTTEMIAWFDRRTLDQCRHFSEQIDPDRLFAICGTVVQQIMTAPKLMWHREHEPEAWARSAGFLNTADYIAFRLSGEKAQSLSLASRTGLLDLAKRDWSDELLGLAGIKPGFLPPILDGGTSLGPVTAEASAATGLPKSTLVAVGGHDHVCGALAAGAVNRGDFLDSIGTSECLFVALDTLLENVAMGRQGYTLGAHARERSYIYGGLYTSGVCYDWIRRAASGGTSHEALLAAAEAVAPGSLGVTFIPHLRLSNTPHMDSQARAAFIGLTTDAGTPELTRAVLEGVAFEGRATIEPLLRYAGLPPLTDAVVVGGMARNELLLRIKASVMNMRLHVLETEEAGALGAAMLGGIAAGIYDSVDDAVSSIVRKDRVIEPEPAAVEKYDTIFTDVYQSMYDALRPFNHRLYDLFTGSELGS